MLRFLVRALGWLALAGAFAVAVMDGARSIANEALLLTPLGATLARLAPAKFEQLPGLATRIHPKLWDPLLLDALYVPTSAVLAGVGIALAAAAARRERR